MKALRSLVIALFATAGCAPQGIGKANPDFLVIAHRGAPIISAENTIRSFEVAAALGATAIETDVCITKDNHLVLWHDRDPDDLVAGIRQLGQEGLAFGPRVPPVGSPYRKPVEQLTLQELRDNYGYNDAQARPDPTAPIATFDEMIDFAQRTDSLRAVYVDIKLTPTQTGAVRQLVETLSSRAAASTAVYDKTFFLLTVHSGLVGVLEGVSREGEPEPLRTVIDFERPGALKGTVGAGLRDISTGLTPAVTWSAFRSEVADMVRARERHEIDTVTVWTFDDPRKLAELLYYSVDGIMTNDVALLHRMWWQTIN
jgi:glycerophosphoryl diester phosphodiesterase